MTTSTKPALTGPRPTERHPVKVWLTETEHAMLNDLKGRGSLSLSATVRAAILTNWERTFHKQPAR